MPSVRRIAIGLAIGLAIGASGPRPALAAAPRPIVTTEHGCDRVGQPVRVSGSGFTLGQLYDIAIDGVDFGQSRIDPSGSFAATLVPGGLGAGIIQHVDQLDATDGILDATTHFTLTRAAGARFLGPPGNAATLRASFQAWGFALDGTKRPVHLHYVSASGASSSTVYLGRTSGQCGYLQTAPRPVFPFSATPGNWILQLDTRRRYAERPSGPVARISVRVG
jgi:hypothetical protein